MKPGALRGLHALVAASDRQLPIKKSSLESAVMTDAGDGARCQKSAMKVTFWGVHGTEPTPTSLRLNHVGNSACVEVQTDDGQLLILDCGTGIGGLGRALEAGSTSPLQGHLLVSHTHWDHIRGFPLFAPIYVPSNTFAIYGPRVVGDSLEGTFLEQLDHNSNYPMNRRRPAANLQFQELFEEERYIGRTRVRTLALNHTSMTLGFRIEHGGCVLVYIPDHEPYSRHFPRWGIKGDGLRQLGKAPLSWDRDAFVHGGDRRLIDFVEGADLLIQDAQYLQPEYESHLGFGHGSVDYALGIAVAARVKQLVLFHHDLAHDDALLAAIEEECQAVVAEVAPALQVTSATERSSVLLKASQQAPRACTKVLVVEDDPDVASVLTYILREEGIKVINAGNGQDAIETTLRERPDLILLDIMLPIMDGYAVCHTIRSHPAIRSTPIILLTGLSDEADTVRGFQAGANDYIIKPFSLSQVRARTRAWLSRLGHLRDKRGRLAEVRTST